MKVYQPNFTNISLVSHGPKYVAKKNPSLFYILTTLNQITKMAKLFLSFQFESKEFSLIYIIDGDQPFDAEEERERR
jgi:hypothetical protein